MLDHGGGRAWSGGVELAQMVLWAEAARTGPGGSFLLTTVQEEAVGLGLDLGFGALWTPKVTAARCRWPLWSGALLWDLGQIS